MEDPKQNQLNQLKEQQKTLEHALLNAAEDVKIRLKNLNDAIQEYDGLLGSIKELQPNDKSVPPNFRTDVMFNVIHYTLAAPLCKMAKLIVPDIRNKLEEIVQADNYEGIYVLRDMHGADAFNAENDQFEIKVSAPSLKNDKMRSNFNWIIPHSTSKGLSIAQKKAQLLNDNAIKTGGNSTSNIFKLVTSDTRVTAKPKPFQDKEWSRIKKEQSGVASTSSLSQTEDQADDDEEYGGGNAMSFEADGRTVLSKVGGGAVFIVTNHLNDTINEYFLSGFFLHHFFERLSLGAKMRNYNFGSDRCKNCMHYHRIDRLSDFDQELATKLKKHLTGLQFMQPIRDLNEIIDEWRDTQAETQFVDSALDWNAVYASVSSQCKNTK